MAAGRRLDLIEAGKKKFPRKWTVRWLIEELAARERQRQRAQPARVFGVGGSKRSPSRAAQARGAAPDRAHAPEQSPVIPAQRTQAGGWSRARRRRGDRPTAAPMRHRADMRAAAISTHGRA
jgi:hypothetical protein